MDWGKLLKDIYNAADTADTASDAYAAKTSADAFRDACIAQQEANTAENRQKVRESFTKYWGDVSDLVPSPYVPFPFDKATEWSDLTEGTRRALARDPLGPDGDAIRKALDQTFGPRPDGPRLGEFERNMCRQIGVIDDIKKKSDNASGIPSPIILDLDGDGVETTDVGAGAYFDHASDGFAEQTGWAGKDDGLLVRDLDGNGVINSGCELFGSETLLANGQKAANGFEALRELDSNNDGVIDANDSAFSELRVWKDANGNGCTDVGELFTLEEAGVKNINIVYSNSNFVDAQGNAHRQVGSYSTTDGEARAATDVWVKTNVTYGVATEWLEVPDEIAALPNATGYGNVYQLHQALVRDETGELKALVTAFAQATSLEDRDALVTSIIYHWTGVQDVDPTSRAARMIYGNAIGDARKLEALEEFMGEEWVGVWCWGTRDPNPHGRAAPVLLQAWDELKALVYGQLMAQSHLQDLFSQIDYRWDEESEAVVGDLSSVAQTLEARIQGNREEGLTELGDFLHSLKGMGLLNRLDVACFKAALLPLGTDVVQTMDIALKGWVANGATEGDDVLRGSESNDLIDGLGGNDQLLGRGGNDTLIGGTGNDVIDGGAGNDELRGGIGSDAYRFGRGDGNDIIIDDSWQQGEIDRIELKAGLLFSDVRLERVRTVNGWQVSDDLKITIRDTGETLTIKNQFNENNNRYAVEEIAFADGTVWDVEAIISQVLLGEAGNEELRGFAGRNDVIRGGMGNNRLEGLSGDDLLDGGAGNDELRGGIGSDAYRFGRGDGNDIIIDDSWQQGEIDRIELKAGLLFSDVRLERVRTVNGWQVSDDLKITIRDTGETLTIRNHFNESTRYAVEEIAFADGTVWDVEAIRSQVLLGEAGNEELRGFAGRDDVIWGDVGNDKLQGLSGDDLLDGGDGNDELVGGEGSDVLIGGAGDDRLEGGTGSDTYVFGYGDGHDIVVETSESGNIDTIALKPGITPDDVLIRRNAKSDLVLTLKSTGDSITVLYGLYEYETSLGGIDRVLFDDGTEWDLQTLTDLAIQGTSGDDAIVGTTEADIYDGQAGNDTLRDRGGDDIYRFGIGDGHDVIEEAWGMDTLTFKAGIGPNDVDYAYDNNDLVVTLKASGDTVRIKGWLRNYWEKPIDFFRFENGTVLSAAQVSALVGTPSDSEVLYGSPGDDGLTGSELRTTLYGLEGNDVLRGGAGEDTLYGNEGDDDLEGGADRDVLDAGEGNNIFRLERGSGLDEIIAHGADVANDRLVFGAGIQLEDISVQIDSAQNPHIMVIGIGGDDAVRISVDNYGDLGQGSVQRFVFADGTELSLEEMIAKSDAGVIGEQWLTWNETPLDILASESDDYIYTGTGDDRILARGNNDEIRSSGGNDLISAGSGNDVAYGGPGDDVIAGEQGDDVLDGSAGDDVFVFNKGDGNDRIISEYEWNRDPEDGTDTVSFGAGIATDALSACLDAEGKLKLLVNGGTDGSVTLYSVEESFSGERIIPERLQFIAEDGSIRIFDFKRWVNDHTTSIMVASREAATPMDLSGYEMTGTVLPAGGLAAVAYALTGDLFATPALANNMPTEGNDLLFGTPSGDVIDALGGDDVVIGEAGNDQIFGGAGNDVLGGGAGDDMLDGGLGNDILFGGAGDDFLAGGGGVDALYGGTGGDTYLFRKGDGQVTIDDDHSIIGGYDSGEGAYGGELDTALNVLQFGDGIRYEDLRFSQQDGDLVIETGSTGDRIVLRGYQANRETQTRSVDVFRFEDGTEIVAENIEPTGKTEMAGDEGGWLDGTPFADTLIGGDGDDVLNGQGGSDRLAGGAGSDTYRIYKEWGTRPTETLIAETWREDDFNRIEIEGEFNADDLHLEFDGRDLLLRLNDEGDVIRFAGFDPRTPGMQAPVAEIILSWQGVSLSFDDLLARGVNYGGHAEDVFDVNIGDGEVFIEDIAAPDAGNVLRFGPGIDPEALRTNLRFEEDGNGGYLLLISYGGDGDILLLAGFNPSDVLGGGHAVDRFEFADGSVWDYATLVSNGFVVEGDEQSNELTGTNLADRLHGGGDHDALHGGAGSDELHGEQGSDMLYGGAGDDAYVFNKGDGVDTIIDSGAVDFNYIRFGTDIRPEDIRHEWDGTTLVLHYSDEDAVRIDNYYGSEGNPVILALAFEDGTAVSLTEQMNRAPLANRQLEDTVATEDQDFSLILPSDLFSDPDASDEIQVVVRQVNGEPLPTWLSFDPVSRTLSGRPANDYVGDIAIVVEGMDHFGAAASTTFNISVQNTNDAPIDSAVIVNQTAAEDAAFTFTVPADVFVDVDAGDVLGYSATLDDGSALPDWLVFNAATQTFSGTPENDHVGSVSIRLTATDLAGASASQTFTIDVANTNDVPVVLAVIGNQTATEDAAFTFTVPADAFVDVDAGDVLGYSAALADGGALPDWLVFDAATQTFSGTPANGDVGSLNIKLIATDLAGTAATQTFNLDVGNTNDAPAVSVAIGNLEASEDSVFNFIVPVNAFSDVDIGDQLTLSATLSNGDALPSWLTFDAATGTFTGTPANGDVGSHNIKLTATDLAGASATQTFNLDVGNTNDAPVAGQAIGNQTASEDAAFSFTVPSNAFSDVDVSDNLTLSTTLANGDALPSWLTFDAATGTFTGTPTNDNVGSFDIRLTATDLAGATATQTFNLDVGNTNDAPVVLADVASVLEDGAVISGNLLANDSDVDAGTVLQIANPTTVNGTYGNLSVAADGQYEYQLNNASAAVQSLAAGETVIDSFAYGASDGLVTTNSTLDVSITGVNDAPIVAIQIADQTVQSGQALSFQFADNAFTDVDHGDVLAYSATQANGTALPSWLSFDANTRTFSGSPAAGDTGTFSFNVTATDLQGAQVSQQFDIAVTGGANDAPITHDDSAQVSEDCKIFAFGNVLANDSDPNGHSLSVANPGFKDGEWGKLLMWSNGSYQYLLENWRPEVQSLGEGQTVYEHFSYQASNGSESAEAELVIAVSGKNDVPWLKKALADKIIAPDANVSWQIPAGSFVDIDQGDTLTYTAKLSNGNALPSWLKFDAATQTFSGKAPKGSKGNLDITITASDGHGACSKASDTFRITFDKNGLKGNEGLGNGEDPPPPGHDCNQNDGAGSSHGHKGHHDNRDNNDSRDHHGWHDKREDRDEHGQKSMFAYLDLSKLDRHSREFDKQHQGAQSASDSNGFYQRWSEMAKALAHDRKSYRDGWSDVQRGADVGSFGLATAGFLGTNRSIGVDPVCLAGTSGTLLKGSGTSFESFKGLQEGLQKL